MDKIIATLPANVPGFTFIHAPLFAGVDRYVIFSSNREIATVLLLPEGLFSLFSYFRDRANEHDVALAIGRVVAAHTKATPALYPTADVFEQVRAFESDHGAQTRPDGIIFAAHGATHRIKEYTFRYGDTAAILLVTIGTVMPVAWVLSSEPAPAEPIFTAIGLILSSAHEPITGMPLALSNWDINTHQAVISA